MSHTAEIIAVGTEILLGNIANTDAQGGQALREHLGVGVGDVTQQDLCADGDDLRGV